jgi:hypothetical protein
MINWQRPKVLFKLYRKASTNYKNFPNIEFGYNALINKYSGSTYYTDKPFARLDYYFLKSFSFVSEYEFYHYYNGNKTVDNEYDFLSASLIYQKRTVNGITKFLQQTY